MRSNRMPAKRPPGGYWESAAVRVFVSGLGDITMERMDRSHRASLCWSGSSKTDAWAQARIIAAAWQADHENKGAS